MALYPQRGFFPPAQKVTGPVTTTELDIGKVVTNPAGMPAGASITGSPPRQLLNLAIPQGHSPESPPPTTVSMGEVKTGAPGTQASASMEGSAPSQTLNLTIPQGMPGAAGAQGPQGPQGIAGANATPVVFEVIESKVITAGQKVAVTFAKKYASAPTVIPNPIWAGQQMTIGQASEVTLTGCNVTVMQSTGTLILNGSPFGNAPAGTTFRMLVIGTAPSS